MIQVHYTYYGYNFISIKIVRDNKKYRNTDLYNIHSLIKILIKFYWPLYQSDKQLDFAGF